MHNAYKKQVKLLLEVLPEVAKETCFAMHGGTAINLFVRDMPRLSVDIDLTYIPITNRPEALKGINDALIRVRSHLKRLRPTMRIQHKDNVCKLLVSEDETIIKIEVNMVGRGLISAGSKAQLCHSAQKQFDAFCATPIVSIGQLYGGKICAALDRQHPRDLFDIKLLLDNEGLTDNIKHGFIYSLISSNRPTHEMLSPNLLDQRRVFENQFDGMSDVTFSYEDFEATRYQLIEAVTTSLNEQDKAFLLSVNRLAPDWSIYDFQAFPSVKWKLLNIEKFREKNSSTYQHQLEQLQSAFEG